MFCKNCGTQNSDGARFCAKCGADLSVQATETQYQQQDQFNNPYAQQQPMYNAAPQQQPPMPGKGLAIASMVLGIISLLCFPIITGTLGIIFGGVSRSKGCTSPMAIAGIVCGIVGIAAWIVMLIACDAYTFIPSF